MSSPGNSLFGRIETQSELSPAARSLAFIDRQGAFRWRSRAEVLSAGASAAAELREQGLAPGGVLVVVSVDPEECATLVLAGLYCGALPLLLAPPAIQGMHSSLTETLLNVLERTQAQVACLSASLDALLPLLASARPGVRLLRASALLHGEPRKSVGPSPRAPGDLALLQLTSGTTGFPRIATWRQDRLLAALDGMASAMELLPDDVYLNWTPLYHDMGLVNNFLLCQARGIPLALLSPLDVVKHPALWLRSLETTGATTTWSPNFGFALAADRVQDSEIEGLCLEHVRGCWNAAERVHLETLQRFHRRFAPKGLKCSALRTNFGCVETIGGLTFSPSGQAPRAELVDVAALRGQGPVVALEPHQAGPGTQWIVSCGRPYPGAEIVSFDAAGARLPEGQIGTLGIRSPGRFEGYLGEPDSTAACLRGDFVFPGDEGYLRAGELFWTGRSRERLNLQGRKHDPSEFERALLSVEGLRPGCFVVFGIEDSERGTEVLIVLAEVESTHLERLPQLAGDLRRAVATELGLSIAELRLVPKGTLTKTSSGKRRHLHFRDSFLAGELKALYRSPPAATKRS